MGRISVSPRYVIEIIGMDLLSSGNLGGGGYFRCFGELGASGRRSTMKIGRLVRDLHKLT